MAGAPPGNHNAAKAKIVEQALRKAAARDDYQRLRDGCERLMDAFQSGQPWALQLVFDRLDGKPAQQLIATDTEGRALAIGLVAYAAELRPDDPVQVHPPALPAPDIKSTGQRH